MKRHFIKSTGECAKQISMAIRDSFKRLLAPSIETEFRAQAKEKADEQAIRVFAENLKQLLMSPPLGQKRVLAIDPGFPNRVQDWFASMRREIFCTMKPSFRIRPSRKTALASKKINTLVNSYKIEAIAIGNGTASRETE